MSRDAPQQRNFHGRLRGKTLRPMQRRDLETLLPRLRIPCITRADNPDRARTDPGALFGGAATALWLEIGFGGGEHLLHQARRNPSVGHIGCEPFVNGVAMLLGKLRDAPPDNLRIHPGDVRDLFDVLPDACIARVCLLYPDPWPKTRHHGRRFVTPQYLDPLARVMTPGGLFRIATDIPDYVRQTLEEVPPAGFERLPGAMHTPWDGWLSTRYEQKALRAGRCPHYLQFRRNGAPARG